MHNDLERIIELRSFQPLSVGLTRGRSCAPYVFPNAQPRRVIGKDGMPSKRPAMRPMSEGALGSALRRLGYSSDTHVPHGFRSSFSTMANTSRLFDADIIEAALAHSDGNQIRGIYNRATYDADRARLAQWWADYLDELRALGRVVQWRA